MMEAIAMSNSHVRREAKTNRYRHQTRFLAIRQPIKYNLGTILCITIRPLFLRQSRILDHLAPLSYTFLYISYSRAHICISNQTRLILTKTVYNIVFLTRRKLFCLFIKYSEILSRMKNTFHRGLCSP